MGLRDRIKKLEHETQGLWTRAVLNDGSVVYIRDEERFAALLSLLDEEPHPLHDTLARLAPGQEDPSLHHLANLFVALEGGREHAP